ncbi:hypothetical protein GS493_23360 [Rhodococcus hoagii]|nr:hypothetical protein [Prescottella equi]
MDVAVEALDRGVPGGVAVGDHRLLFGFEAVDEGLLLDDLHVDGVSCGRGLGLGSGQCDVAADVFHRVGDVGAADLLDRVGLALDDLPHRRVVGAAGDDVDDVDLGVDVP